MSIASSNPRKSVGRGGPGAWGRFNGTRRSAEVRRSLYSYYQAKTAGRSESADFVQSAYSGGSRAVTAQGPRFPLSGPTGKVGLTVTIPTIVTTASTGPGWTTTVPHGWPALRRK